MRNAFLYLTSSALLVACSNQPDANAAFADNERLAEYDRQTQVVSEQQAKAEAQLQRAEKQADRMDALMMRWEEQADRYDAILKRKEDRPATP